MVIASGAIDRRHLSPFTPTSDDSSSSFFSQDLVPTERQVGFWNSESMVDHKGVDHASFENYYLMVVASYMMEIIQIGALFCILVNSNLLNRSYLTCLTQLMLERTVRELIFHVYGRYW